MEELKVDGNIIFKEIGWEIMHWIHLAQDKDKWWALIKKIMNLLVP
jgi:hypothetical protein